MPARRPVRPASGTALAFPSPEDDIVQRALDRVELVIGQLQSRIGALSTNNGVAQFSASIRGVGLSASAPNIGTHARGEILLNADPSAGGFVGWVCVSGGSPGTWKTFGAISP